MARTSRALEGHIGGYCYYIEGLQWSYFYWGVVFSGTTMAYIVLLDIYISDKKRINYGLIIGIWIIVPFLLYTIAKTKISWYILPIYPAISLSIGATSSFILKEKNRNLITQIVLIAIIAISIYKSEEVIISKISNPQIDLNQELIQGIGKLPEYQGKRIYINHFEQSYWLSTELYADLIPIEGGAEGFLEDNTDKTLLFITKDDASYLVRKKIVLVLCLRTKLHIFLQSNADKIKGIC